MRMARSKTEGGFVFLSVVFIIVAFTILGAGAVALITGSASSMQDEYLSQKAFDLANAGLAYEAEQLENDSDWSDNTGYTKAMDPGQFEISYISQGTDQCKVKSVGTVGIISRAVQQTISRGGGPKAFSSAMYTEGEIDVGGSSSGDVQGPCSAGGSIDEDEGVTFHDSIEENNPDAEVPAVDWAHWQALADTVISGNHNFSAGTYSGVYYITGNVGFTSDVTFNGTIVSTGKVTINGASNVAITATAPNPAIIAKGTITLNGNTNLVILGFIITMADAKMTGNQDLTLTGGVVAQDEIEVSGNVVIDVTYDENWAPSTTGFIGGEGGGSGENLEDWEETI